MDADGMQIGSVSNGITFQVMLHLMVRLQFDLPAGTVSGSAQLADAIWFCESNICFKSIWF